jgi:hypothetical protein
VTLQTTNTDGTCRIWLSLAHAAEAIDRSEATIKRWIANGDLHVHRHDLIPGVVLIEEIDLLQTEAAVRARAGASTRFRRAA